MQTAPGRSWSELEAETTFEVAVDGFVYKLTEPSVLQLVAKGFVPAALATGLAEGSDRFRVVGESKFLIDEKMQDAMLLAYVYEPALWAGKVADCPEGSVPLVRIGRHRDDLVAAILTRVFQSPEIRGAAFRGEGRNGTAPVAGRKGKRPNADGAAA